MASRPNPPAGLPIPGDLVAQLIALKPVLERNGSVVCRRRSPGGRFYYRLRYRDPSTGKQPAIALPGRLVADVVEDLLTTWQKPLRDAQKQAKEKKEHRRQERQRRRQDRRAAQALAGGGRHCQRWVGRAFDEADSLTGPAMLAFAMSIPTFGPGRRAGRPLVPLSCYPRPWLEWGTGRKPVAH